MTATRRRVALAVAGLLVASCGATVSPSPRASPRPSSAPSLTPVPGAPSATPTPTRPPTSETEFGRVWDALPPSWPTLPGQSQSEVGSDSSDKLIVHGDPKTLAGDLRAALAELGWTVDVGSPLEDGSVVLDARHAPDGCKAQARFSPNPPDGDPVIIEVYYGATCPFD